MEKNRFVGVNRKTQLEYFDAVFQKYIHETHGWKKRYPSAYHRM